MPFSWQPWVSVAALATAVGEAFGFGMRNARARAIQEERMKEVRKELAEHALLITSHTACLAQHEGSFKVIDTKLDYISKAIDSLVKEK
jgi:hypothetical protein